MQQSSLYDDDVRYYTEAISITYCGVNELLAINQIDALDFSISIGGYTKALTSLGSNLFGLPIQVSLVTNEDGSFKTILSTTMQAVTLAGSLCGISSWFGIDSTTASDALFDIQKAIV